MTAAKQSDNVKMAIIGGIVTIVVAFLNLTLTIKNVNKTNDVQTKVNDVQLKVDTVKQHINSRMDQMLKLVQEKSNAEGVLQGKADQVTSDSLKKVKK